LFILKKNIQNTWKYIYENTDDEVCEIFKSVEIICKPTPEIAIFVPRISGQ